MFKGKAVTIRAGAVPRSKRAREQESKRAREQESKGAREQESKRAREQESKRARHFRQSGKNLPDRESNPGLEGEGSDVATTPSRMR